MDNWLSRTENLIGTENIEKLQKSHVTVLGCGGVGSYSIEALARAGIGNITIIDNDTIDITNINRQIMADTSVIGLSKVEVMKNRLLKINPKLNITIHQKFIDSSNVKELISNTNYIVDAIDCVSSKISVIEYATTNTIPIISSMGTGNKLDPTKFEITDISKTSVCPLAKVIRKELRNLGINHLKVLYSKELPIKSSNTPTSISFVPSVAGLIIASEVVKDLLK